MYYHWYDYFRKLHIENQYVHTMFCQLVQFPSRRCLYCKYLLKCRKFNRYVYKQNLKEVLSLKGR